MFLVQIHPHYKLSNEERLPVSLRNSISFLLGNLRPHDLLILIF